MKIYLAGPMSHLPDYNYPAFHAAAAQLRAHGHTVENPAENPEPECKTYEGYLRMSLAQVLRCDTVAVLPGWELSKGSKEELHVAHLLKMRVVRVQCLLNVWEDPLLKPAAAHHGQAFRTGVPVFTRSTDGGEVGQ
ncbi:DUF4406 domain-containing protein [Variovorax sp. HJSM1_2]|uniref:DUF4406 domain-containing protein n=1 Tax=Variovorax sp. HJSM1_2 TaxID=3366263 RepID=UPI003BE66B22